MPASVMQTTVATTVNNVKNNGPELVEPLPAEGEPQADGPAQDELF